MKKIVVVILCLCIFSSGCVSKGNSREIIRGIEMGMSLDEVLEIEEEYKVSTDGFSLDDGNFYYYKYSEWYDIPCEEIQYHFGNEDELHRVTITFSSEQSPDDIYKKVRNLYGKESEKEETEYVNAVSTEYKWEKEKILISLYTTDYNDEVYKTGLIYVSPNYADYTYR